MNNFDAVKVKDQLVQWIRNWFKENGDGCNAVIGLSGGCDSTVVAGLCKEALGSDRVISIALPDEGQDEHSANEIANFLGINYKVINIGKTTKSVIDSIKDNMVLSNQTIQNIPPRIRMTTLYAISQSNNGRVIGTDNASESYLGYSTQWGDNVADCMPILNLTKTEVIEVGLALGIPEKWVKKLPSDDLPLSQDDQSKFGFTYAELDDYIRNGIIPTGHCHNNENECLKIEKIKHMHKVNQFKMKPIASFEYKL